MMPRRLGLLNDPSAQRRNLSRFSLVFRSPDPLVSPGSCPCALVMACGPPAPRTWGTSLLTAPGRFHHFKTERPQTSPALENSPQGDPVLLQTEPGLLDKSRPTGGLFLHEGTKPR